MKEIPVVVRDHVKSLLNIAPGVRPDANQTIKVCSPDSHKDLCL